MYKRVFKTAIVIFVCKICIAQNVLYIDGSTKAFSNGTKIVIKKRTPFNTALSFPKICDTAIIHNNKFSFKLKTSNSELYILSVLKNDQDLWCRIFLQPGKAQLVINDSLLQNITVRENKAALDYKKFEDFLFFKKNHSYLTKKRNDYKKLLKLDSIKAKILKQELIDIEDKIAKSVIKNVLKWIEKNPYSQINSNIIYDYLRKDVPENQLKKVFYMLPISGRKNTWGQELEYFFDRLAVGKKPPNFIQPDTSGNEIILTNFVGKYVLLDFWASWCRPCREATPELVKIYDEFKYKNFEIISVAIDENNDKWIKALSDDNMTWINVSDLKSWKNAVAVAYNITSIPFNLLLDDKGIIIEKNIWGEELHETLQKRLK